MSVDDVKIKPITVVLDKERSLVFDLNAICELEEKYGSMQGAMDAMSKGSMKAVRTLLYAGLKHEDDSLTEEIVGKLIDISNMAFVGDALNSAVSLSLPSGNDEEGKNEPQPE
ncbi:MAG: hypothetical protein WA118_08865 [Carboxydocellales bacterium]